MNTGGARFWLAFRGIPGLGATEGYAPNLPVARARHEPLGIEVVEVQGPGCFPFVDADFDVVNNRPGTCLYCGLWLDTGDLVYVLACDRRCRTGKDSAAVRRRG